MPCPDVLRWICFLWQEAESGALDHLDAVLGMSISLTVR
jgi:hypothetical protein